MDYISTNVCEKVLNVEEPCLQISEDSISNIHVEIDEILDNTTANSLHMIKVNMELNILFIILLLYRNNN